VDVRCGEGEKESFECRDCEAFGGGVLGRDNA
jgi:hypothetical protein